MEINQTSKKNPEVKKALSKNSTANRGDLGTSQGKNPPERKTVN